MADQQPESCDRHSRRESPVDPDSVSTHADCVYEVMLGRTGGLPSARTEERPKKQWQPPKNETTPSNRAKGK